MGAKRCALCLVDWPATSAYDRCPECGTATWYANGTRPDMSSDEANARLNAVRFKKYYAIWRKAREGDAGARKYLRDRGDTPPDVGVDPGMLGTEEGKRLRAELQELEERWRTPASERC